MENENLVFTVPPVKNNINAFAFEVIGEINDMPSMTVPDQSMTIQEILRRFASGLPVSVSTPIELWDEEDELPDPRTLDLSEREEYAQMVQEELNEEIKEFEIKNKKHGKKSKQESDEITEETKSSDEKEALP